MTYIPFPFAKCYNSTLAVGTKATMCASPEVASHQRSGRVQVAVYNSGSADVFFGGEDVTTSTGIPIKAGETVVFPLAGLDTEKAVYLVAAEGGNVTICEMTC